MLISTHVLFLGSLFLELYNMSKLPLVEMFIIYLISLFLAFCFMKMLSEMLLNSNVGSDAMALVRTPVGDEEEGK